MRSNYKFLLLILVAVMALGNVLADMPEEQTGVNLGTQISGFTATDDAGNAWSLQQHLKNDYLVVYFYPAAMTSGCTKQACNARDHNAELAKLNADIVGVSGDRPENLRYFKQENNLNFTLLADTSGQVAQLFKVPVNKGGKITRVINGKEVELIRPVAFPRWTFILDKNKKVVYKNTSVNATEDIDQILSFLKSSGKK